MATQGSSSGRKNGSRISSLGARMPVANTDLANQYAAGRDIRMQQAVAAPLQSAGGAVPTKQQAQAVGVDWATQKAQQDVDLENRAAAARKQVSTLAVGEAEQQRRGGIATKSLENEARQFDLGMIASTFERNGRTDLANQARELNKLKADNNFRNEVNRIKGMTQLATSKRELEDYRQAMQQADAEDIQAMELAYSTLVSRLDRMNSSQLRDIERQTGKTVAEIKADAERKVTDKKNRAAVNGAIWKAASMVGVAVAGG